MKKYIFGLAALLTLANACRSLDVTPPNSITDEQIQEILKGDDESKKELILNLVGTGTQNYFNLAGYAWNGYSNEDRNSHVDQDFQMNMRGNDVIIGSKSLSAGGAHASAYNLIKTFSLTENTYPWYAINALMLTQANKVLLYITPEAAEATAKSKLYRGQALVLRAYSYMQLMERFQPAYTNGGKEKAKNSGMPIYKNYGTNAPVAISSAKETYEFILSDLAEAVDCLTETGYTSETKDIDLGVAQFLRARAALWFGDWDTAIEAASDVVAHFPNFIKEENYGAKDADFAAICAGTKEYKAEQNAFITLQNNPEVIMGFVSGDGSNNLSNGDRNVFANGNAGSGYDAPRMDSRLVAKLDDKDFRKSNIVTTKANYTWIIDANGTTRMNEIPEQTSLKFSATTCKSVNKRNHELNSDNIIFRSSEAYLMLAEAYAQNKQDAKAKDVLNKLLAARAKAGQTLTCDNYAGMSGMTALQMVQLQTRIELWCEGGREFYNNKRWGIDVDRNGSTNHWSSFATLTVDEMNLAIPKEETSTNTHWAD